MTSLSAVPVWTKKPVGDPSRHTAPSIAYQVHPVGAGGFSVIPTPSSGAPLGGDRSTQPGARFALPTGSTGAAGPPVPGPGPVPPDPVPPGPGPPTLGELPAPGALPTPG